MKRRIKQNIWGNWKGYEGTRRAADCRTEFGTDSVAAYIWLMTGKLSADGPDSYTVEELLAAQAEARKNHDY